MNFQGFDVRHLAVLDTLFTEKHVGRAAQRLSLSQPAVSNALAWLRRYFDDPLLVRRGGGLALTPFAERLRDPVRRLLIDLRTVATKRPNFDPATSANRFRLIMSDYVAALTLRPLLDLAAEAAPNAHIEVIRVDNDATEFKRGEVDLVMLPQEVMLPQHGQEPLFDDHWVCVGWAGALAGRDRLGLDDYRALRHILPDQPQTISYELAVLGIERDAAAVVPYALLPEALVGTPWIATVPRGLIDRSPVRDALVAFDTPFPAKPLRIAQQWHLETDADDASIWLRALVRRAVARAELTLN